MQSEKDSFFHDGKRQQVVNSVANSAKVLTALLLFNLVVATPTDGGPDWDSSPG